MIWLIVIIAFSIGMMVGMWLAWWGEGIKRDFRQLIGQWEKGCKEALAEYKKQLQKALRKITEGGKP